MIARSTTTVNSLDSLEYWRQLTRRQVEVIVAAPEPMYDEEAFDYWLPNPAGGRCWGSTKEECREVYGMALATYSDHVERNPAEADAPAQAWDWAEQMLCERLQ